MIRTKSKKKSVTVIVAVLAAVFLAFAVLLTVFVPKRDTRAAEGDRVTMLDLTARYPIDYVVGPIDAEDVYPVVTQGEGENQTTTIGDGKLTRDDLYKSGKYVGQYHYKAGNYEKDALGNKVKDTCTNDSNCTHQKDAEGYKLTNNIYGIPADQYFDVESYIYTTGVKDSEAGRTLYGWKADIRGNVSENGARTTSAPWTLAENGEILSGGTLTDTPSPIAINVTYTTVRNEDQSISVNDFGTTTKYALIAPDDITAVGRGSAAYVIGGKTYYSTTKDGVSASESFDSAHANAAEFTDFACFITDRVSSPSVVTAGPTYFWQPRERLAGVYFPSDSRLTTIEGTVSDAVAKAETANRTTTADKGKSAFQGCDNTRFMILPDGVKTIGQYAFNHCSKLVDTNIPTSVTSVGKRAYQNCEAIMHITLPNKDGVTYGADVFSGCKMKHVENGTKYPSGYNASTDLLSKEVSPAFPSENSDVYVMGNKPNNGVLDTGAFCFERTPAGKVSALSIAGETGESEYKVFAFPSGADFVNGSDRRLGVAYDYLDCNGETVKNSLDGITVSEYDIAAEFAKDTWCQNVVLPKEVKTVGANAFYNSHVKYLETYATNIEANAFNDSGRLVGVQWIYLHQAGSYSKNYYNIGENAFAIKSGATRHVVYEDYNLYKTFNPSGTGKAVPSGLGVTGTSTLNVNYQIPFVAHIENEDEAVAFKDTDIAQQFFNDRDYVKNPVIENGSHSFTYTKRLNGNYAFNQVKQPTGEWTEDKTTADNHASPVLSNMTSTVWYGSADYSGAAVSARTMFTGAETGAINIYTKNIARPQNIKNKDYTESYQFGDAYKFGTDTITINDDGGIDYFTALGLSQDDYAITAEFKYPNKSYASVATSLHHAGAYNFSIGLNPKWGVWSEEFIAANSTEANNWLTAKVTIARKQLDYSGLNKIPQFVTKDGKPLQGSATPLYSYNDGWYLVQKSGEDYNGTPQTVTASYVYQTGKDIELQLNGEKVFSQEEQESTGLFGTLGDAQIISRSGLSFSDSRDYYASYTFRVKFIPDPENPTNYLNESDYIFRYGEETDNTRYNVWRDEQAGLTMNGKTDTEFRITKRWFIVVETNIFGMKGDKATAYSPLGTDEVTYDTQDLSVKEPELYRGETAGNVTFAIVYTPVGSKNEVKLTGETPLTLQWAGEGSRAAQTIGYYINPSMPAGKYVLRLSAKAVTYVDADGSTKQAQPISVDYDITVLPKEFDATAIAAIHETMRGGVDADAPQGATGLDKYVNAYPLDGKKLHESIAGSNGENKTMLAALKAGLAAPAAGTYWGDLTAEKRKDYFATDIGVGYNLEGSGNTVYSSESVMLGTLASAGTYTLYYSISALNYNTVGGADSPERQQRGFRTTLYEDIKVKALYDYIVGADKTFFQDVVYTGEAAHTRVPVVEHYKYAFEDSDYVNARNKASVTLTLYRPALARWNSADVPSEELSKYFELSDDGASLKVFYNILPAKNEWRVTPQMPGWTFNGFDVDVNFITAGLKFTGAEYRFALVPSTRSALLKTLTYDTAHVKDESGIVYFTVNASGKVEGETAAKTAEMINALNAVKPDGGGYFLVSFVDGIANPAYTEGSQYAQYNVESFKFIANRGTEEKPDYFTTVAVGKATNDWSQTPNVMRWSWGNYNPERNTISAVSVYPNLLPTGYDSFDYRTDGAALPVITYRIVSGSGSSTEAIAGLESFTSVTDAVANVLRRLPVGTYTLYTSLGETEYYSQINEVAHVFNIMPSNNSWQVTPGLTGWTYRAFAEGNFREGVPTFGNKADVVYKLYEGNYGSGELPAAALRTLTVTNGALSEGDINYLTTLGAANGGKMYTLVASLAAAAAGEGETSNYGALEQRITFRVTQLTNTWDCQPSLSGWVYNSFRQGNFLAGIPTWRESKEKTDGETEIDALVHYSVSKKGSSTALVTFTLPANGGTLSSALIAELNGLDAGDYMLTVSYPGTDNYAELSAPVEFTVSPVQNSWSTQPRLTSYPYHGFVTSNFLAGVPTYPEEGGTVYYAILGDAPVSETKPAPKTVEEFQALVGQHFTSINDVKKYLNGLTFGTYYFAAFAAGAANYSELFLYASFGVTGTSNTWMQGKIPSITGWTYNSFTNGLLGDAKALYGTDTLLYSVYNADEDGNRLDIALSETVEGKNKTAFTEAELLAKINALGAGRYVLSASIAETQNYGALSHEVRFTVAKATNAWKNDAPPTITGWTYDGKTAHTPTTGEPVVAGVVSTEFYKAHQQNGEWVADLNNKIDGTKLAEAGYGTYAMVVTVSVDGDKNYLPLVHTAIFEIARGSGSWSPAPELTLTWAWGVSAADIEATDLYKAAVNTSETVEIQYTIAGASGTTFTEITVGKAKLLETLRKLNVGVYDVTVFVNAKENDNYTYESRPSRITVTEAKFEFTNASTSGWTWGDAAADKVFNLAVVGDVMDGNLETGSAKVSYSYRKSGETNWTSITDNSTVCSTLYGLDAGEYEVRIQVSYANYTAIDETVSFTIGKASYRWAAEHAPANADWIWSDKAEDEAKKTVVEPILYGVNNGVHDVTIALTFTLGGRTYNTFGELFTDLKVATAGTYNVTVTVNVASNVNYNDVTGNTFTVTVTQATNEWIGTAPVEGTVYAREYQGTLASEIEKSTAKFGGDAKYYTNAALTQEITSLNEWANNATLAQGEYEFYTAVKGKDGKYNGLCVKRIILVNGLPSEWANKDNLTLPANAHRYDFTYSDALVFGADNVTLPLGKAEGTTTYTLTYKNYKDEAINPTTRSNAEEVYVWMNDKTGKAIAGTYTIEATFKPTNGNYATLTYTVTVEVARAQLEWNVNFDETEYTGTYGKIEVPTPSIKSETGVNAPIQITITDSRGVEQEIKGTLSEFVKTLNVGDYVIAYSVASTSDYIGLTGGEVRMFIRAVNNVWLATGNVTADEWTNGKIWTYQRGADTVANHLPVAADFAAATIGKVTVSFNGASLTYENAEDLNEYLTEQNLAEGRYTLRFSVEADANGNYNGLVSNCTIVVNKTGNSWSNADDIKNYVGNGKVDITDTARFVLPKASVSAINGLSLVRYEIKNLDGTSRGTYTTEQGIKDAVAALTNGTYTVIARIGVGEIPADPAELNLAWNKYVNNYQSLETSFTITLTPKDNSWTTPFEGAEWIYGEKVNQADSRVTIARPVAEEGNAYIVYTLSGKTVNGHNIETQIFKNTKYTADAAPTEVFGELIKALNGLLPGTYTVTASMSIPDDASDKGIYYASETATALFVVSRAANGWSDDTTADNADIEWTYEAELGVGAGKNQPIVFNPNHGTLTITVNGRNVTETVEKDYNGNLNAYLSTLGAATHTIIASVEADGEYSGLTRTVRLTVKRTSNEWTKPLGLTAKNGTNSWTWDNKTVGNSGEFVNANFVFDAPIPAHGSSVVISVYRVTVNASKDNVETEVFTYTLNVVGDDRQLVEGELSALYNRIIGLDAVSGSDYYYMVATVAYSENYDELNSGRIQFTVTQATNAWTTDGKPDIEGWNFAGTTVQPTSEAKYGANTVKYYYAAAAANEVDENVKEPISAKSWTENLPMAANTYWLKAVVAKTDNYTELVGYCKFSINQAENAWVNMPGVIPWAWNGYDKNANLFSGSARSNGTVTFSITASNGQGGFRDLLLSDFVSADGSNVSNIDRLAGFTLHTVGSGDSKIKVVSDEVETLLKVLKPGAYRLTANAASGENLAPIDGHFDFSVAPAANEWTTSENQTLTPNVLSFVYGQFVSTDFRAGETKYGTNVLYSVTGKDNDDNVVDGAEGGTKKNAVTIAAYIAKLPAGSYRLQAWVPAGATYGAFYSETTPYPVVFNVSRASNAWSKNAVPAPSVSVDYSDLQKLTDISGLTGYAKPAAISGTKITFSVLNGRQGSLGDEYNGLETYADLLSALKKVGYGSFIIRATVGESCNYTAISADTSLTITRMPNAFRGLPEDNRVTGSWGKDGNTLTFDEITADHGEVDYAYLNTKYDYDGIVAFLREQNAGTYNITVSVTGMNEYEGLADTTIRVDIAAAANAWQNGWKADGSITVGGAAARANASWAWGSSVSWQNAVPVHGTTVFVEIRKQGAADATYYVTVNYSRENGGDGGSSALTGIARALSALEVGNYTLTVTAPASTNWTQLSESADFEITTAENGWTQNPVITGNGVAAGSAAWSYKWTYGAAVTLSAADAFNSEITLQYFEADGTSKLSEMPTAAGSYIVRFIAKENTPAGKTPNYETITQDVSIKIEKATGFFTEHVSANGWVWDCYDRAVNRFAATAAEGSVTFAVLNGKGEVVEIEGQRLEGMKLVNVQGEWVMEEKFVPYLNKLTAATYKLRASVPETENYLYADEEVDFVITVATNTWTTIPSVVPWALNQWNDKVNAPVAEAQYGYVRITITQEGSNIPYYYSYYNETKGEYVVEINKLNLAEIGWYTMMAEVPAAEGKYQGTQSDKSLRGSMRFQIFVQGSSDEENYWTLSPAISFWTATPDKEEIVSNYLPIGKPARGLPYFVFYKGKLNEETGKYEEVEKITETSKFFVKIDKGTAYFKDWYLPMEPGHYFMYAYAEREGVASDMLKPQRAIEFDIYERANRFTQESHIDSVLYLGDRANWVSPTAKTFIEGDISYVYVNVDTKTSSTDMPTEPGSYTLVTTVEALFCRDVIHEISFKVEYSTNSWIRPPRIEDWSEEFDPTDPTALATVGSENIEYWYAKAEKPDEWTKEKPTGEGKYLMRAVVRAEGYTDLVSDEYAFTIEPEFDRTFLIVDIALGCLVVVFTVVVIYYAVRRYREC